MKATRISMFAVLTLGVLVSSAEPVEAQTSRSAVESGQPDRAGSPALASGQTDRAGTVVAIDTTGEVYTVDLGDEIVSLGSILQVYRRLPAARGTAAYRNDVVWWEVGQLTVTAVGGRLAVAAWSAEPIEPIPTELEESGAPASSILIGDRVRATGGIGARPAPVRVTFTRSDLFAAGEAGLGESGTEFLTSWLAGLRAMSGPIEVEVHPQIEALGTRSGSADATGERNRDYPIGPSLDRPTRPSPDIYEKTVGGAAIPEGREVLVVGAHDGQADTWHYVDPIRLARRQGDRIADALAAYLQIDPSSILVRVVPRPLSTSGSHDEVPGYESQGDQIRILAASIEYEQPEIDEETRTPTTTPREPRRRPRVQPTEPEAEQPRRRRRLLERPPEVSSNSPATGPGETDAS